MCVGECLVHSDTIIEYHNNRNSFLTVQEAGSQDHCQSWQVSASFGCRLFTVSSLGGRDLRALWGLFCSNASSIMGGPTLVTPPNPNHLPKIPPPNTITLEGVSISTCEFWGDTNIQIKRVSVFVCVCLCVSLCVNAHVGACECVYVCV